MNWAWWCVLSAVKNKACKTKMAMKQRDSLWGLRLGVGTVLGALSLQAVSQEAVPVSDIGAARPVEPAQRQCRTPVRPLETLPVTITRQAQPPHLSAAPTNYLFVS